MTKKFSFNGKTYPSREDVEATVHEFAEETYDELLDAEYGEICIHGYYFTASEILKTLDPICYNQKLANYEAEVLDDIKELK